MPLPAALAERLRKRGILRDELPVEDNLASSGTNDEAAQVPQSSRIANDFEEEVFAAHSSTDKSADTALPLTASGKQAADTLDNDVNIGCVGCTNRFNPYHTCNEFCKSHLKALQPTAAVLEYKRKMLEKFPLPENASWCCVYEPSVGQFYYWNTSLNLVSWLSPAHPNARPTVGLEFIRKQLRDKYAVSIPTPDTDIYDLIYPDLSVSKTTPSFTSSTILLTDDSRHAANRAPEVVASVRDAGPVNTPARPQSHPTKPPTVAMQSRYRPKRQNANDDDELDPMDPAAYSDAPVGTWRSGLEEAKSKERASVGVESTPQLRITSGKKRLTKSTSFKAKKPS